MNLASPFFEEFGISAASALFLSAVLATACVAPVHRFSLKVVDLLLLNWDIQPDKICLQNHNPDMHLN